MSVLLFMLRQFGASGMQFTQSCLNIVCLKPLTGNHIFCYCCTVWGGLNYRCLILMCRSLHGCVCAHVWVWEWDLESLIGSRVWMPITDCFMELLFVVKHHKHLMTSLFLLLETLSGSFLNLGVEKTEVKTSGSFFCCYAGFSQALIYCRKWTFLIYWVITSKNLLSSSLQLWRNKSVIYLITWMI